MLMLFDMSINLATQVKMHESIPLSYVITINQLPIVIILVFIEFFNWGLIFQHSF